MADHTAAKAIHATLTGTTADEVTLTGGWQFVEIVNHHASELLYALVGSAAPESAPEAADDDLEVIGPGERLRVERGSSNADLIVSLVGDGNAYAVIGVDD